jgi:ACS family D-galactonate transporter-like MFS transporter
MTPGVYRANLLVLLALSQALAFIDRVNLSVVVPTLIKDYGYTPASAGFLMSIFSFGYLSAVLFAGPLVDLIKAKRAYPLAIGCWSLATALCGTSVSFPFLAICRALVGIGEAPMIPLASRVIKENFDLERRGFAISFFFAGNKVGLAVGIPLAAVLLTVFGRPWVFYATGLIGAACLIWWLLVYRAPIVEEDVAPSAKISWLDLFKYRTTWGMILGQAGYFYVFYVFATWLPGFLVLNHKLSILESGLFGMLPFVVGIACTLLGGWLNDRLIARGASLTLVRKSFTVGGIFGATVFTVIGALVTGTIAAIGFMTLAVASLSLATASINAISIDVAPPGKVSSFVSLQNFGGNIGAAVAPAVTGLLISSSGSFILPLVVTAIVGLVLGCGGIGLLIRDIRPLEDDSSKSNSEMLDLVVAPPGKA